MSGHREEIFGDKPWPDHYTFVPAQRVGNTICHSGTTVIGDDSIFPFPAISRSRRARSSANSTGC